MVSVTQLVRGYMAIGLPQPWAEMTLQGIRLTERRSWPFPRKEMGRPLVLCSLPSPMRGTASRAALEQLIARIDGDGTLYGSILGAMHPGTAREHARPVLVRAIEDPASFPLGCGLGTVVVIGSEDVSTEAYGRGRGHEWQIDPYARQVWPCPRPTIVKSGLWKWKEST